MGTFLTFLGTAATALLGIWGIQEEKEQQEEFMEQHRFEFGKEFGLQERQLGLQQEQVGLSKKAQRHVEREARKKWKWMEEEQKFNRAQGFADRFTQMLGTNRTFKQDLMNVWGKRG